jgi:hypothetical protein
MNIVQACWLDSSWCEYCPGKGTKTYLPMTKTTLNPAHICEECALDHTVIGWYDDEKQYYEALYNLKESK